MFSKLCSTQRDINCHNTPHFSSNLTPPLFSWHKSPTTAQMDSSVLVISYPHNTQQVEQTNIQALSEVRTNNSSNQAASDQRLRPQTTGIGSF